jgi:uncharacterized protein YkwD
MTLAVEALIAVVVLLGLWSGWRRGFVTTTAEALTLAAVLAIALAAYRWPARWLDGLGTGVWTLPLAFLATLIVARIVVGLVLGRLVAAVPAGVHQHGANRALGLLPGAALGLLHAAIVAALLLVMPLGERINAAARDSPVVEQLSRPAQWLEARLSPIFEPAARATLDRMTVQPGTDKTVPLPFRVTQAPPRPDLEARMLDLVNAERAAAGLRPLRADPELTAVARRHSADMFARGYFSHITPEGGTPFDRMRAADVRFRAAGENLALARSLQMAHDGLMDSPGHRANILRPAFGRVGIGVLDGGVRGLMVTQKFRD